MKLASVFSDGAVLQRNCTIPVWGKASPCCLIQGEIAGKVSYCKASGDGDFRLLFPPLEAGGPYDLVISEQQTEVSCVIHDVYVGEVWLASGQSNMEYALGSRWNLGLAGQKVDPHPVNECQEEEYHSLLAAGNYANFHFISLPHCASGSRELSTSARWQCMSEEYATASAVAAWFGLALRERLQVPIGLIMTNWGGTVVEAWTSREGLLSNPETMAMVREYEARMTHLETWTETIAIREQQLFESNSAQDTGNEGLARGWADLTCNDADWGKMRVPGSWIQQGVAGNGAVWIRRDVELDEEWQGKELELTLGGVDKQDIAYFNGVEIGRTGKNFETQHWNVMRRYRVPANLVRHGRNVIAVRAYSFAYDGSFNGRKEDFMLKTVEGGPSICLQGDWKCMVEKDLGRLKIPSNCACAWGPDNPNTPTILFDGMIRPVLPYAMRGAIWYQGESNAATLEAAASYGQKMIAMIRDWRRHWEQPDFPFIQVELANYGQPKALEPQSTWAVLREQQQKATRLDKNVYLATAVDRGESLDIHPQDKKTVGRRLALVALENVYDDQRVVSSGPVLASWTRGQGNTAQLTFESADGLKLKDEAGKAFFLAGEDRRFYPAEMYDVQGHTLVIASSNVENPVAVRYAWADNPASVLYNASELPASPFRTDDWADDTVSLGTSDLD